MNEVLNAVETARQVVINVNFWPEEIVMPLTIFALLAGLPIGFGIMARLIGCKDK